MATELQRNRIILDADKFAGEANSTRTPGLHLTDVLRDIETMLGRGYKVGPGAQFDKEDLSQFALQGYLWEDCMTETLRRKVSTTNGAALDLGDYERLPEMAVKLDGSSAFWVNSELDPAILASITRGHLLMSPDGRRMDPLRLLECKWTTKSANMKPEIVKRIWFEQVKNYLFGMSLIYGRLIDTVEWHVQFAVGSRWGEPPIYEQWIKRYEPTEIYGAWNTGIQHVQHRVSSQPEHPWRQWV